MVRLVYFVHSTTTDNELGIATGHLHGELSKLGRAQAKKLRLQIADRKFDAVYVSDLKRAIDTAALVFVGYTTIRQDSRLRECNYGELNGKLSNFKDDSTMFIHDPYPNGESYEDVEVRLRAFCNFLKEYHDGQCIAVVSHQAPQLALDVILGGKTWLQAIAEDWRQTKAWQPSWDYLIS